MSIFDLFKRKKVSSLEKEVEELKTMLDECKTKLIEKQEHINQTNSYWKKKMHLLKKGKQ